MTDIAACLLAFERPHYLKETVESLENLVDKDEVDWFIFQDGAVNLFSERRLATDSNIAIAHNIIRKADLPNKSITRNDFNHGIPHQVDKALSLFRDYDMLMFFEDDVVVSKYAIRLNRRIVEQFPDSVPTLYTNMSIEGRDIDTELDIMLKSQSGSFHTFCMRKEVFKDIESYWSEYFRAVNSIDYEVRDHEKLRNEFDINKSSVDAMISKALREEGYYRIRPLISRALYIGMEGLHSSVENYRKQFEGNLGRIDYEQDAELDGFRLHDKEEYT